jgi:DNA-binding MarR family transcriptional regulator
MESRGLIGREKCSTDSRGAEIVLTPNGATLFRKASAPHLRAVRELFFDALDPALLQKLDEITTALRDHLTEVAAAAKP